MFNTNQLSFIGNIIFSEGMMPNEKKIEAITKMKVSENVDAILRLQGMVNYLARFLPKLLDVMEQIRKLTHHKAKGRWTEEQDKAFKNVKQLVTSAPILKYYDPEKEFTIQCYMSRKVLGAVLLQAGKPFAYVSQSLPSCEQKLAQTGKESLAKLFAVEEFHEYTYDKMAT